MRKIQRAIISVTDKAGIAAFAKELSSLGVEIISTGGTAELLKKEGIKVIPIQSYTGFPEMLDGRVKTLHPKIHGGILAIRDNASHSKQTEEHGILPIDMIVVNLYAFEETVKKNPPLDEAIENIDIGGPTMLRAAAKNYKGVAAVTDPADYASIIEEMKKNSGGVSRKTRFTLAKKVFQLTARYDAAISNHLGTYSEEEEKQDGYPETYGVQYKKIQDLRYGENPHQSAAFYARHNAEPGTLAAMKQYQGKELSFNNILDLNSALEISREFKEPACVIIKHNNPCGVASNKDGLFKAYELALSTDSRSAFGGIVGFNASIDAKLAEKLNELFLEAVIAPSFSADALKIFEKKKNLRVIEVKNPEGAIDPGVDIKRVTGGVLIQGVDTGSASDLKTVTKRGPTDKELENLMFAWKVCKHVKSNAIIFAKDLRSIGIGAGQMSRIDSTNIAAMKAADAGLEIAGSVMASDAFFPFRDNVDMAAEKKITAIIQPGGSIKDNEVIAAADEHGIAMVFTGIRHFKH
ncbi:MAG: bifunctional phosphoribosylaminoimidazolecarboxamide formyltransferase/IMP cyclohydrolase [Deltaproteobacteria bacterium]|nr:bifunctional phosphoribosylaminoimidazolecarboxamide formyltransferase/IMP cyclohydrolase [Deltaproteobacteria bacterium]